MNKQIDEQVQKILNSIKNEENYIKLEKLDSKINADKEVQKIIKKFNVEKEKYDKGIITEELVKIKKELYENKLIKEYKNHENNLHYLIVAINKKFNDFLITKSCSIF